MDVASPTGEGVASEDRSPPQMPVAIVGYSYRMPGGIRTDDEFWSLLSEREIVQEPITDRYGRGYRPVGEFSGPGRFASPYEGLIRDDAEKLFDRSLFGLSHNEMTLIRSPDEDAVDLCLGDLRALRLEPPCIAQQSDRPLHRCSGPAGGQLAPHARGVPVRCDGHQPGHAGQSYLLSFQSDGAVDHLLHSLFGKSDGIARSDECVPLRRLRPGSRRFCQLTWEQRG